MGDMLLNLFVFDENGNEVGDEVFKDGWDGNDKTELPTIAYQLADKATPTRRQKDNDTAVSLMRELQASGRKATAVGLTYCYILLNKQYLSLKI